MRQLLEFSSEPITISSARDHKLIEVNAAFLERTGYTREEVIGRSSLELGLWEDESVYASIGQELGAIGAVRHRTIKYRSKNGELGLHLACSVYTVRWFIQAFSGSSYLWALSGQ